MSKFNTKKLMSDLESAIKNLKSIQQNREQVLSEMKLRKDEKNEASVTK